VIAAMVLLDGVRAAAVRRLREIAAESIALRLPSPGAAWTLSPSPPGWFRRHLQVVVLAASLSE
jgi:hypothetical protein